MSNLQPVPLAVLALNRTGFGPRPGDIAAFEALGDDDQSRMQAYVDAQIDPESIDDSDLETRVAAVGYESPGRSRREFWQDYVRNPDGEYNASTPVVELRLLALQRAVHSKRQLLEMLADFWHNHFNVAGDENFVRSMMVHYDSEVIRRNALGNFREMLGGVAQSTSMLFYLDNVLSTDAGPNENWARELLELHTLGAEHYLGAGILQSEVELDADGTPLGYVDDDVYEATRAFTGWTVAAGQDARPDTGEFLYVRENHDRFQKQVLGRFIEADQADLADGNDVLDVLAVHPGTARHIARKLCIRFVADTPPEALVESAAAVFLDNVDEPDQLAQVVRHILLSDDFAASSGCKVRRPFDFVAALLRQVEAEIDFGGDQGRSVLRSFGAFGHRSFGWPQPDGYPEASGYWLNTNSLFTRWGFVNSLLASRVDDDWFIDVDALMPTSVNTATTIVDYWLQAVLGFTPDAATRDPLIEFMGAGFDPNSDLGRSDETHERVRALLSLIYMTPEYLWR